MNKIKSQECEIVQDLLPLYYDDVCTPSSKKFVQQHLEHCTSCRKIYEELSNDSVDRIIEQETHDVLERHAKKERTSAYKAGLAISALLLIPILITLLISLSTGGDFGVFSVVAASMLLVAALTAVPLMTKQNKLTKSILIGMAALLLIIFFVDRINGSGQFLFLAIPTIFGISIPLFPFVIRGISLPPVLADKKALITIIWDTAWLFLTIFIICSQSGDIEGMRNGNIISLILMSGIWLIFLTARYLPANKWIKSGLIFMIIGIWTCFSNDLYFLMTEHKNQLTILSADFSNWSSDLCINANIYFIILIFGIIAGLFLVTVGICKKKRQ